MAYKDFKDLFRRTTSDKVLHDKVFILLKIKNMMDINMDSFQSLTIFLATQEQELILMQFLITKNKQKDY